MKPLLIRCSSLSRIMGQCKDALTPKQAEQLTSLVAMGDDVTTKQKTERTKLQRKKDNAPMFDLSEGAKNFVKEKVKEYILDYYIEVDTKQMQKGTTQENKSIELFNQVTFNSYKKNIERVTNEWITGECDILGDDEIFDIKTSWSKATFPMLPDEISIGGYLWQGRGYMMLYDKPKFTLVYALVDTPDELLEWEDIDLHHVEDIAPELRITTRSFKRDKSKEELIKHKVSECRRYAKWYLEQIKNK